MAFPYYAQMKSDRPVTQKNRSSQLFFLAARDRAIAPTMIVLGSVIRVGFGYQIL